MKSRRKSAVPSKAWWDRAVADHSAAQTAVRHARDAVIVATVFLAAAEREFARAALAHAKGPSDYLLDARNCLVWWYNNGDTSTRGDRPCVLCYDELPKDLEP